MKREKDGSKGFLANMFYLNIVSMFLYTLEKTKNPCKYEIFFTILIDYFDLNLIYLRNKNGILPVYQ